jgi:hypothetical protein
METTDGMMSDEIQDALTSTGIVGFNPVTDAMRDTRNGRIHYVEDNEIKWTSPPGRVQRAWRAPGTMKPERFKEVFTDVDNSNVEIIDKTVFNALRDGPLKDITHAHDGLAWGITTLCRYKLEDGEKPHWNTLQAVAGIGETLTEKILSNFDQFTAPEPSDESQTETTQ